MNISKLLPAFGACLPLFLTGCGDPTLDLSGNKEEQNKSLVDVVKSYDSEDKIAFLSWYKGTDSQNRIIDGRKASEIMKIIRDDWKKDYISSQFNSKHINFQMHMLSDNVKTGCETQEPQDYFPSSNVYRVVVSEDGNTVSVYKGSSTPPLFTNTTGDTDRIIENKPKADKTSVTVEKLWSDGAANHTNDTVTVQLYETTEDLKVSGGTINVQVVADKWIWEGDTNQEKINTAPTADGASLSYKIYKYGDANQTAVASGTLNNGNGWSSTHQLNDMAESEHIKYVVEVTDQDGNVITNASVYDPEDGSVQGSDSDTPGAVKKVHVQADVQDVQTPKMTISASNIRSKSMYNKWRITFQEVRLMYDQNGGNFSGYVNSSNPLWSENYFTFDGNNGSETKEITLPDLSSVSSSELNKYWYRIAFDAQEIADDENVHITVNPGYNLGYENRYTTTKGYYDFQGNRSDYLYIPASATNITISFTGTNSGTLNIDLSRPSLAVTGPQDAMYGSLNELISSGILGGEENTAYADGNKHGNPVVLSNGNWTHTWDNLISTETVTEGGYTIIRTHHYYVREVSVHFADDSIDEDTVLAEYSYIFNEDGDPSSGIKKVVINNTVPPKTSITVTKEWKNQDGTTYEPPEGQRTITFDVYQKVDGTASVYKTGQQIECTYDTASQSWKWGTVSHRPQAMTLPHTILHLMERPTPMRRMLPEPLRKQS